MPRTHFRPRSGASSADCFYKILRVSQNASPSEIKESYRRLALELHPDRHKGCSKKLSEFKRVNEAYAVLMDVNQRREYDTSIGGFYNHHRYGAGLPRDYGRVYAPSPPPEWKTVWNFQKHYEMHYGNGIAKEAFERMRRKAEKDGDLDYHSPLGRGFSFQDDRTTGSGDETGDGPDRSNINFNPYSKRSPQGPPKMVFEYQEIDVDMTTGRQNLNRRERIIHDMHSRRKQRQQKQQDRQTGASQSATRTYAESSPSSSRRSKQHQQQQEGSAMAGRAFTAAYFGFEGANNTAASSVNSSGSGRNGMRNDCVIL